MARGSQDILARFIATAALVSLWPAVAGADIIYGGRTFHDDAFADTAELTGSFQQLGNASTVDEALTGFSPAKAVLNIGADAEVTVEFTDYWAKNLAGADIILYETHSESSYAVAVRPLGGSFTSFIEFTDGDLAYAGETTDVGFNTTFVFELALELDDFGLAADALVDAIRFRRGAAVSGDTGGGDPSMVAVFNGTAAAVPEPHTFVLWAAGFGLVAYFGRRWTR